MKESLKIKAIIDKLEINKLKALFFGKMNV